MPNLPQWQPRLRILVHLDPKLSMFEQMETIKEKIEIALNGMRPFLQADGGDVELVDITDEMEVQLRLIGNCSSCSMSSMTMKAGIESGIRNAIPEISRVVAVE